MNDFPTLTQPRVAGNKPPKIKLISTILVAIIVLIIAGSVWYFAGNSNDNKPEKTFITTVDRGISVENRAIFDAKIETQKAEIAAAAAEGKRDISKILVLGNLYYAVGELGLAVEQYNDILSSNPTDVPALENLGQAQIEMQDYQGARDSWQKAIDLSPFETTYLRLADLINKFMPENKADVKIILEHAITNLGQTPDLMIKLGDWYADNGDFERAISHYEVALQLVPENEAAREQMELYRQQIKP